MTVPRAGATKRSPAPGAVRPAEPTTPGLGLSVTAGPARRLLVEADGASVGCVVGAADHLPFRGGSFHEVTCDGPVRTGTDAATTVAEVARVARQAGRVVLRARNRQHVAHLLATAVGRREPSPDEPVACSWGEVEELARPVLRLAPFGRPGTGRGVPALRRLEHWVVVHGSPR